MKKIKYGSKVNIQTPAMADEGWVKRIAIDREHSALVVDMLMVDSNGGPDGVPALVEKKTVHIGLTDAMAVELELENLEQKILDVVKDSGVLPSGGTVE